MDRHSNAVQNESGHAVPGASVLILDQNGQVATIYSNRQGAPTANPLTTDALGRFSFCAADGLYSAQVSVGGVIKAIITDIRLEDPSDGFATLASVDGAALIGTADGSTVQAELDALNDKPDYVLPTASSTVLGGVKVGANLAIDGSGVLSASIPGGTVASVNGVTPTSGNVSLTTDDLPESGTPTNQWFTAARVRAVVLTGLSLATNAAITAADSVLGALGKLQAQVSANTTAIGNKQDSSSKDASGGYAGLTAFAINLKNAAGTIVSQLASAATAARTWTFPDKDGTVAMLSDVSGPPIATYTVGSAVANIDFLNVFTSAYDKYVIEVQGLTPASVQNIRMQLASAGSVDVSTNYSGLVASGTPTATNSFSVGTNASPSTGNTCTIEVRNTNSTSTTTVGARGANAGNGVYIVEGYHSTIGIVSGFRLFNSGSANFTAGTVRVYGIKNS